MLAVFLVRAETVCAFHEKLVSEDSSGCKQVQNYGYEREYCIHLVNDSVSVGCCVKIHEELDGYPDLKA